MFLVRSTFEKIFLWSPHKKLFGKCFAKYFVFSNKQILNMLNLRKYKQVWSWLFSYKIIYIWVCRHPPAEERVAVWQRWPCSQPSPPLGVAVQQSLPFFFNPFINNKSPYIWKIKHWFFQNILMRMCEKFFLKKKFIKSLLCFFFFWKVFWVLCFQKCFVLCSEKWIVC